MFFTFDFLKGRKDRGRKRIHLLLDFMWQAADRRGPKKLSPDSQNWVELTKAAGWQDDIIHFFSEIKFEIKNASTPVKLLHFFKRMKTCKKSTIPFSLRKYYKSLKITPKFIWNVKHFTWLSLILITLIYYKMSNKFYMKKGKLN